MQRQQSIYQSVYCVRSVLERQQLVLALTEVTQTTWELSRVYTNITHPLQKESPLMKETLLFIDWMN